MSRCYILCSAIFRLIIRVIPVVQKVIDKEKISLTSIINTHHHYDHAGGNEKMLKTFPGIPVIAGKDSDMVSNTPTHNSRFGIGKNISVTALHTPCHTQDSICYYFHDHVTNEKAVFTGDTLFIAGCGRFFEGTAQEMVQALVGTLGKLPDETKVYPGHEYTASNLKFVKTVLNNEAVQQLADYTANHEETTGAFTIKDEKQYNPFMMVDAPEIQQAVGLDDRISVMAKLRELKNKM
jgi:hydroxyacylglutathione hydrolase